jgi:ribosome biogenesis GTPase A
MSLVEMKKGFIDRLYWVIENSDLLIEVADARFPEKTRNKRIEKQVKAKGKELIIVLNKSDLVSKNNSKKIKKEIQEEFQCVFVSSKEKQGFRKLREKIQIALKKSGDIIGIIGYPNTGKSSVINCLSKKKVRTSITAGYTRGQQVINAGKFKLIDSPGIIPMEEREENELVLIGAKNPFRLRYPEEAAIKLIELLKEKNPEALKELGAKEEKDSDKILEEIAVKKGRLMKKGIPDVKAVSKQILLDWQKGKIRI